LWGCNSTLKEREAKIELISFELGKGEVDRRTFEVVLQPNASTEIWKGSVPGLLRNVGSRVNLTSEQHVRKSLADVPLPIVVQARLLAADSTVLARYSNWPEPWKYLTFPDAGLKIITHGESVTLSCSQPIKGIVLEVDGEDCQWSDQAIDLMPGDDQVILAKGLDGREVTVKASHDLISGEVRY
jgi:beta-mannosidase